MGLSCSKGCESGACRTWLVEWNSDGEETEAETVDTRDIGCKAMVTPYPKWRPLSETGQCSKRQVRAASIAC